MSHREAALQSTAAWSGRGARWRPPIMAGLAGLGVVVSGYLTWLHFSGALALCAGFGGCEAVQASRYAYVQGIPIAALGLGLFLVLLTLALTDSRTVQSAEGLVPLALFGLSLGGSVYSGYLTYVELFVIEAVCPWCVTSALLTVGVCGLAAWELRSRGRSDQ